MNSSIADNKKRSMSAMMFCIDTVVAMLPLILVAIYYYGARVIMMCLASVVAALMVKLIFCYVRRRNMCAADLYCVSAALSIALFCPASAPYWLPMFGAALTVAVRELSVKFIGRDAFCSAAFALAVMFLAFGSKMSYYTAPGGGGIGLFSVNAPERSASILQAVEWGRIPAVNGLEMLLGRYGGPIGTTVLSVLIMCAAYIAIRRPRTLYSLLPYMAVLALFGVIFVRVGSSRVMSAMYETLGGSTVFCAAFVAAQPGTMPSTAVGRALSGVTMGILTMIMRYIGLCDSSCVYALLLVSLFADWFDRPAVLMRRRKTDNRIER